MKLKDYDMIAHIMNISLLQARHGCHGNLALHKEKKKQHNPRYLREESKRREASTFIFVE